MPSSPLSDLFQQPSIIHIVLEGHVLANQPISQWYISSFSDKRWYPFLGLTFDGVLALPHGSQTYTSNQSQVATELSKEGGVAS